MGSTFCHFTPDGHSDLDQEVDGEERRHRVVRSATTGRGGIDEPSVPVVLDDGLWSATGTGAVPSELVPVRRHLSDGQDVGFLATLRTQRARCQASTGAGAERSTAIEVWKIESRASVTGTVGGPDRGEEGRVGGPAHRGAIATQPARRQTRAGVHGDRPGELLGHEARVIATHRLGRRRLGGAADGDIHRGHGGRLNRRSDDGGAGIDRTPADIHRGRSRSRGRNAGNRHDTGRGDGHDIRSGSRSDGTDEKKKGTGHVHRKVIPPS